MSTTVFLSLGSNQGDRLAWLEQAVAKLSQPYQLLAESSVYETAPWGKTDQPAFLNMVVKVAVSDTALDLLGQIQAIELQLGRKRLERWGPRTIDIDILFYGDEVIDDSIHDLEVPHPRLWQRAFVLVPLLEIEPKMSFQGQSLAKALEELETQSVTLYEPNQTDR